MRMTRWRAPERQTPATAATETGADEKTLGQAVYAPNGSTSLAQKIGVAVWNLIGFILIDAVPIVLIALATLSVFDAVARFAGVRS